jgi:hypothetical protein
MYKGLATLAVALLVCAAAPLRASGLADDAAVDTAMLRVFLKDGSSLVSYGEPARVGNRVVFSMPTTPAGGELQLHLVNLAADRVDWDRTTRYADSAHAARYLATQAAPDYAELSSEVAQALNDVAATTDSAARASIVEKARTMLADWPPKHYGYKQGEVLQMIGMLDETIADLRATSGADRFNLNFVTITTPPATGEPLLPRPATPKDAIDQVMLAAKLAEEPAERTSLLTVVLKGIERDQTLLPKDWAKATAAAANAQITKDLNADGAYKRLTDRILGLAVARTRNADVRGIQRLVGETARRDQALGAQRPDVVKALLDSLDGELDAARRLRLARDQWALQARDYRRYRRSIVLPMARFARLKPALNDIKALSGSSPGSLATVERLATEIRRSIVKVMPPADLVATHALLVSAADLAVNAAGIRREAALAGSIARAWDASAAAAGSLMLTDRARTEIQTLTRIPQLPQLQR